MLKHKVLQKQKDEEKGEIQKTGLFSTFLLFFSTVVLDFHLDDPSLLWGVISLQDRQLLGCPDSWASAILATLPLPSPTTLPAYFCDIDLLHRIFSQGCLETPGTQSSSTAFHPSPQQRASGVPHVHPHFMPSPQRALGSIVLVWEDVLSFLSFSLVLEY